LAGERKFVTENIRRVLLKEYFMKEVKKAGFGGIDIQRTPMGTRVTLMTERPGLVIGRRGSTIKALTEAVENWPLRWKGAGISEGPVTPPSAGSWVQRPVAAR